MRTPTPLAVLTVALIAALLNGCVGTQTAPLDPTAVIARLPNKVHTAAGIFGNIQTDLTGQIAHGVAAGLDVTDLQKKLARVNKIYTPLRIADIAMTAATGDPLAIQAAAHALAVTITDDPIAQAAIELFIPELLTDLGVSHPEPVAP